MSKAQNYIDLKELSDDIRDGFIKTDTHPVYQELMILHYTSLTQFSRAWTPLRMRARGLVINHRTGECINNPFPKFFNLSEERELDEKYLDGTVPFTVENKHDGSLAIGFVYQGEMIWTTKGSFNSPHSAEIMKLWTEAISHLSPEQIRDALKTLEGYTLLAEFESPDYQIVRPQSINQLKLLSARHITLDEPSLVGSNNLLVSLDIHLPSNLGLETKCMHLSNCKTIKDVEQSLLLMDKNGKFLDDLYEGVVIRYEDGKRIKIKTPTYVNNHALLMNATPKKTVKMWGKYSSEDLKKMLQRIPEEVLELHLGILKELDDIKNELIRIVETAHKIYESLGDGVSFGIFAKRLPLLLQHLTQFRGNSELIGSYLHIARSLFFAQQKGKEFPLKDYIIKEKVRQLDF